MNSRTDKPRIAVHKFSSCDGCQLAFLNMGEDLLTLSTMVDIIHFAEAGPIGQNEPVDIAFIEGSISTPEELERIAAIRAHSQYLVTMGACATSGGLQALRNMAVADDWVASVYAEPGYIHSLRTATPIGDHIKVDMELWGCPVSSRQVIAAIRALLFGVVPVENSDKVCLECKRRQTVCVMVSQGIACMGPVTRSGCGALCPTFGRDCYGCYGPGEQANTEALGLRLHGLGLQPAQIARRFLSFTNSADAFHQAGLRWKRKDG